jgi:hypothetical protein
MGETLQRILRPAHGRLCKLIVALSHHSELLASLLCTARLRGLSREWKQACDGVTLEGLPQQLYIAHIPSIAARPPKEITLRTWANRSPPFPGAIGVPTRTG